MEVQPDERDAPFEPPSRREALVPAMAVAAVAVVALTAAVMVKRGEAETAPAVAQQSGAPLSNVQVVQAPPLKAPATNTMGGAPACTSCGVVQMVVAVRDRGANEPRAFQMHVRMDDGTLRTFEQRGALAAGSRVIVDGNAVKPMT